MMAFMLSIVGTAVGVYYARKIVKVDFPKYQTESDHGVTNRRSFMDGTRRSDIRPGLHVSIVLKQDQRTGKLTGGVVRDILTKSPTHPHGIKVRLETGEVGRVKEIMD